MNVEYIHDKYYLVHLNESKNIFIIAKLFFEA